MFPDGLFVSSRVTVQSLPDPKEEFFRRAEILKLSRGLKDDVKF